MRDGNDFNKNMVSGKLATRFVRHVIAVALITTLLMSLFLAYGQYKSKIKRINEEVDNILRINQPVVAQSLWILDIHSLDLLVRGFLLQREVVFARITDEKGNVVVKQGHMDNDAIRKTVALYHKDSGKNIFLGKLTLAATKKLALKDIESSFMLILAQSILLILIIVAYVLYIFKHFISKHLIRIQQYTSHLVIGKDQAPLRLERIATKHNNGDELDRLVKSINYMFKEANSNYHKVEYQALHDGLTGLYNRRAIAWRVNELIADNNTGQYNALILIDLDHFKLINESQGYHVGDKILKKISFRLRRLIADNRNIARTGGDEFVLIVEELTTDKEQAVKNVSQFARKILNVIQKPLKVEGSQYHLSAGIGIEVFNKEIDFETILKHADNALYHAKMGGVNQLALFYADMQHASDKRMKIESLLRNEIKNDRLIVNYQPKCDKNGVIYSAEALVRMRNENGQMVSPADFIPIAEETGLIIKLGQQIVKKVFEFIIHHQQLIEKSGIKSIAVNVSPTQFSDNHFRKQIAEQAKKYNIPDDFIVLEITEEAVVSDMQYVIDAMLAIKKSGFKLSIDDFGTGYSSLRYLQKFPIDELKIDKSFIDEVTKSDKAQAIIKTIIDMAKHLGFEVLAEGVEDAEQLKLLNDYGCRFFQGYLFFKPLNEDDFVEKLKDQADSLTIQSQP
jgi:diguanylate cyclase (GGDEF)-like protein